MKKRFIGNLSITTFLKKYWQKKPLLIRKAFPAMQQIIDKKTLFSLALKDTVQSRSVEYLKNGNWDLQTGPFQKKYFTNLKDHWTLLVQDVNHYIPEAQQLLQYFNFIPYARLDDLMVSYATNHGGVGPHYDSYDVFLLQGIGKRLWQITPLTNKKLIDNAPLKILKNFKPKQEWILEPGDMLYLPPHYAHNGIAIGESMTYSIGFRAPTYQELMKEFLLHLHDNIDIPGMYTDPDLTSTQQPARISAQMLKKIMRVLSQIKCTRSDIQQFIGIYLTKPKPYTFFDAPEAELTYMEFFKQAKKSGMRLDLKSQMLFTHKHVFINGESHHLPPNDKDFFIQLANERQGNRTSNLSNPSKNLLYQWYLDGYLRLRHLRS